MTLSSTSSADWNLNRHAQHPIYMLRRRTGELLSLLLLVCLLAGIVGTIYVAWIDPHRALTIAFFACVLALAVCRALDEFGWLLAGLATIFIVLANGLYALFLLGVSWTVISIVASLLAGLILLILGRALLAAGSADYPYDD